MQTLHVHDTLIFGGFEFGQMRVYRRCFSRVRVHMEKRRIENREKKRGYHAAGRYLSHGLYSEWGRDWKSNPLCLKSF
jgi:hypothetical protein